MAITEQNQPTAGNTIAANRGETNLYFIGIGSDADGATTDAPTYVGTPNGTAFLHAVAFSTSNTVTQAQAGTFTANKTTFVGTFDPLSALAIGETITYDIHVKDIVGWVGEYDAIVDLPTGQATNAVAWTQGNYYKFDGTDWINEGGNYLPNDALVNKFSSITFTIQAGAGGGGGGTGTFTGTGISQSFALGASALQFTATGVYQNGTAPVILSTVDDPANSGTQYAYNAAASSETAANIHGTLDRVATGTLFDDVQYNPTGNEVVGDSYVYNIVAVDSTGAVVYGSVQINISAGGGGGGGTTAKSINTTALASFSSQTMRLPTPFANRDFSSVLNNPSGTGTLTVVTPLVNCSLTDFSVTGNSITCTKSSGGDYSFSLAII